MGVLVALATVAAVVVLLGWTSARSRAAEPIAVLRVHTLGEDGARRRRRLQLTHGGALLLGPGAEPVEVAGPVAIEPAPPGSRRGEVRLRSQSAGGPVHLALSARDASATTQVLTGRPPAELPPWRMRRSGRTGWAISLLVLAVGWAAFLVPLESDDYDATATVVRSDGWWTCTVTWVDLTGSQQRDETDCFGEPVGSTIEIVVPREDFRGAVTTRPMLALVAAAGAGFLLTAGGCRLRAIARHRRSEAALLQLTEAAPPRPTDIHTSARRDERTTAALARTTWLTWGTTALGGVAVGAVILLGTVGDEAERRLQAVGETTTGTITEMHLGGRLSNGGADVRFRTGGQETTEYVDLGGFEVDYEIGQQVQVLYDPSAPDRFAIDDVPYDPPWTVWPMTVALGGAFVITPIGLWMLRNRWLTARALSRGVWTPVHVHVRKDDERTWFTTDDGSVWRGVRDRYWPDREPDHHTGSAPQQHESAVRDAWWVRDGERAVFSPDRGSPLILARLDG